MSRACSVSKASAVVFFLVFLFSLKFYHDQNSMMNTHWNTDSSSKTLKPGQIHDPKDKIPLDIEKGHCYKPSSFTDRKCSVTDDIHCQNEKGFPSMEICCEVYFQSDCNKSVDTSHYNNDVCVVVRFVASQSLSTMALLSSLAVAGRGHSMKVIFAETDDEKSDISLGLSILKQNIKSFNAIHKSKSFTVVVSQHTNRDSHVRKMRESFKFVKGEKDYGYVLTDVILRELTQTNECKYLLFTNGDNLYSSSLMDATLLSRAQNFGLIGFFFSSHYFHDKSNMAPPSQNSVIERYGQDVLQRPAFIVGGIDLGAVMFHSSLFKENDVNFVSSARFYNKTVEWSDGFLIQRLTKMQETTKVVIPRILFLHQ